ncbi:hypothetical protein JCM19236_1607 [Vibrio sp. JCM 19236]|nr:hypothetical protein JCM19236_1607 [Vibrio sp. JCM 19236]
MSLIGCNSETTSNADQASVYIPYNLNELPNLTTVMVMTTRQTTLFQAQVSQFMKSSTLTTKISLNLTLHLMAGAYALNQF